MVWESGGIWVLRYSAVVQWESSRCCTYSVWGIDLHTSRGPLDMSHDPLRVHSYDLGEVPSVLQGLEWVLVVSYSDGSFSV